MLQMIKKYTTIALLISLALMSTACSSFTENAVKAADATTLAVDAARGAYANNYQQLLFTGKMTQEDKVKVEAAYAKYQAVARTTVLSIRVYSAKEKLGQNPSKEEVTAALGKLSEAFGSFYDLLKAFSVIQ